MCPSLTLRVGVPDHRGVRPTLRAEPTMLFSAKAEYACVAMMELASRHGDPRPVRLTDIADKHGISSRFLVQILLQLKGAGLVNSTRGAAGGYLLARPPETISLYDVVTVIDRTEPSAHPKYRREPTASA